MHPAPTYLCAHKAVQLEPIPSPVGLPNPGMEPASFALQVDYLPTELSGKPIVGRFYHKLRENFTNLNCPEWHGLF